MIGSFCTVNGLIKHADYSPSSGSVLSCVCARLMMPMLQLSSRNQASKTDDCHIGMGLSLFFHCCWAPILDNKNVSSSFLTLLTMLLLPFFEFFFFFFFFVCGCPFCFNATQREGGVRSASFMSHHCLFDHCHSARPRRSLSVSAIWPTSISRIDLSLQPGDQFTRDDVR